MDVDVIEVVYEREGRSETFSGSVFIRQHPDFTFAGADFNQVLEFAGDALKRAPDLRLVLKRAEAPYPMALPAGVEELLRTNVPAAIQALSVGPQRIDVGVSRRRIYQGLRRGLDTIADSLGEVVCLRQRVGGATGMQVESPLTGRWMNVPTEPEARRKAFGLTLYTEGTEAGWASVKTEELLAYRASRYWLPRGWNPSRGWINYDLLAYMYDTYKKEKSDVTVS